MILGILLASLFGGQAEACELAGVASRPDLSSQVTGGSESPFRLAGLMVSPDRRLAILQRIDGTETMTVEEGEEVCGFLLFKVVAHSIELQGSQTSAKLSLQPHIEKSAPIFQAKDQPVLVAEPKQSSGSLSGSTRTMTFPPAPADLR